jgi:isopentenyl diphosphate isomerase/L-lactate dehydrogenase-like FMN-dependent dehydrogenase
LPIQDRQVTFGILGLGGENMPAIDQCLNIEDFRTVAKKRLPKWIFEFIDRGTEDETAMPHIRHAFNRIKLKNRAFVDMTNRDLGTTLFGKRIALPMAIAPTASAGLCWYEGELELARAAAKFGIPFTMAVSSTTALEKVAEHAGGTLWFQMYMWENRDRNHELARRAERAGYEALVITADVNLGINREFNVRNAYGNPPRFGWKTFSQTAMKPGYATSVMLRYLMTTGMPRQANNATVKVSGDAQRFRGANSDITWDDFARMRDVFKGKLMLKGIVRPDDAAKAVALGADAVVVSSHGGRNLDCNIASIDALPAVVREVGHKTTVLFDSGIRRGSDMVKAYALGAKAVLSGRPTLYATAAGGEAGALRALNLLKKEYELQLGHVGCLNCSELSADVLATDQSLLGMTLDNLQGPVRLQKTA